MVPLSLDLRDSSPIRTIIVWCLSNSCCCSSLIIVISSTLCAPLLILSIWRVVLLLLLLMLLLLSGLIHSVRILSLTIMWRGSMRRTPHILRIAITTRVITSSMRRWRSIVSTLLIATTTSGTLLIPSFFVGFPSSTLIVSLTASIVLRLIVRSLIVMRSLSWILLVTVMRSLWRVWSIISSVWLASSCLVVVSIVVGMVAVVGRLLPRSLVVLVLVPWESWVRIGFLKGREDVVVALILLLLSRLLTVSVGIVVVSRSIIVGVILASRLIVVMPVSTMGLVTSPRSCCSSSSLSCLREPVLVLDHLTQVKSIAVCALTGGIVDWIFLRFFPCSFLDLSAKDSVDQLYRVLALICAQISLIDVSIIDLILQYREGLNEGKLSLSLSLSPLEGCVQLRDRCRVVQS